jgi:hypothetical protein
MIIIRAESMYHIRSIEYVAICNDFAVVPEGCVIPEYDIEIDEKIFNTTKLEVAGIRKLILIPNKEIENE